MEKGFLILVCTFLVVGIIHVVSMKMTKISEAKKSSYRKLFWYLYGAFFCLAGVINLLEKEAFSWIFSIEILVGLAILILNFLGKIEKKLR
jgi:cell division protein FtsW (lipid II flippase)